MDYQVLNFKEGDFSTFTFIDTENNVDDSQVLTLEKRHIIYFFSYIDYYIWIDVYYILKRVVNVVNLIFLKRNISSQLFLKTHRLL